MKEPRLLLDYCETGQLTGLRLLFWSAYVSVCVCLYVASICLSGFRRRILANVDVYCSHNQCYCSDAWNSLTMATACVFRSVVCEIRTRSYINKYSVQRSFGYISSYWMRELSHSLHRRSGTRFAIAHRTHQCESHPLHRA